MPKESKSIISSSCLLFLEFGRNHSCLLLLCFLVLFPPLSLPAAEWAAVMESLQKPAAFHQQDNQPTGPVGTILRLHQQILPRQPCQQRQHIAWHMLGMARTILIKAQWTVPNSCRRVRERIPRGFRRSQLHVSVPNKISVSWHFSWVFGYL